MSGKRASNRDKRAPESRQTVPRPGLPELAPTRLLVDYEQTSGVVKQLTEVRFKLAAFVPTLTAAAVALLSSADLDSLTRAVFAAGGLGFTFGIVLYDLRNSQLYNSAIGRATALEKQLFMPCGDDKHAGVFGSRADTKTKMAAAQRDRFKLPIKVTLPVRHDPALSLVYTTVAAVWVWVLLDAGASAVQWWTKDATASWQTWVHDYIVVIPIVAAAFFAGWFHAEHVRHDPQHSGASAPPADAAIAGATDTHQGASHASGGRVSGEPPGSAGENPRTVR